MYMIVILICVILNNDSFHCSIDLYLKLTVVGMISVIEMHVMKVLCRIRRLGLTPISC